MYSIQRSCQLFPFLCPLSLRSVCAGINNELLLCDWRGCEHALIPSRGTWRSSICDYKILIGTATHWLYAQRANYTFRILSVICRDIPSGSCCHGYSWCCWFHWGRCRGQWPVDSECQKWRWDYQNVNLPVNYLINTLYVLGSSTVMSFREFLTNLCSIFAYFHWLKLECSFWSDKWRGCEVNLFLAKKSVFQSLSDLILWQYLLTIVGWKNFEAIHACSRSVSEVCWNLSVPPPAQDVASWSWWIWVTMRRSSKNASSYGISNLCKTPSAVWMALIYDISFVWHNSNMEFMPDIIMANLRTPLIWSRILYATLHS